MGRSATDGRTKRVLVMGATGFVGRALVPALVEAGYEVRATTRNPPRVASFPHIEWIQCDVNQRRDVERALEGVDALFFLVHAMGSDAHDYAETERRAALELREAAARAGITRIVYL